MDDIFKLQREYFNLIDFYFKDEFDQLIKTDCDVCQLKSNTLVLNSTSGSMTLLDEKFQKFKKDLADYWTRNEQTIINYANTHKLNSIVLWPDEPIPELAPKFLLYYDIIYIPDTIAELGLKVLEAKQYGGILQYFVVLNEIRELLSAEVEFPLFIIVPYKKGLPEFKYLTKETNLGNAYISSKSGQIGHQAFKKAINIDIEFGNGDELIEVLSKFPISKLNSNIDVEFISWLIRFIIDNPDNMPAAKNIGRLDFIISGRLFAKKMTHEDFYWLYAVINSLLAVFEAREFNSINLNSTNLITNAQIPFSEFKYNELKRVYGMAFEIPNERLIDYSINHHFKWLNQIDLSTCIQLRENEGLEEFRNILRSESEKIKTASFEEFPQIAANFDRDISKKLHEEEAKINNEIQKIKNRRLTTGSIFTATFGLTVSSMAFPALLPLAVSSAVFGTVIGANVKDLIGDVIHGKAKIDKLLRKPISVILKNNEK